MLVLDELRPTRPAFRWLHALPAVVLVGGSWTEGWPTFAGTLGAGLVVVLTVWLTLRNSRLTVDCDLVIYRDALGRSRSVGARGGRLVAATVAMGSAGPTRFFFWLEADGRVALRLSENYWPARQVEAFAGRAGYSVERYEQSFTPSQASDRWPRAFGVLLRRPALVAGATVVLLVAAGMVAAAVQTFGN